MAIRLYPKIMFKAGRLLEELFAIGCCGCEDRCLDAEQDDCKVSHIVQLKQQMTELGFLDKDSRCDRCKKLFRGAMVFSEGDKDFCSIPCLQVFLRKRGRYGHAKKRVISSEPELLVGPSGSKGSARKVYRRGELSRRRGDEGSKDAVVENV